MAKNKQNVHLCAICKHNRSGFVVNGKWKRDKDHNLCGRCYVSVRDRVAAAQLGPKKKYD